MSGSGCPSLPAEDASRAHSTTSAWRVPASCHRMVPDSDKNFSHPSFPLCSALLHSSGLGGCRRTAFPLEQRSWRVVKHKAPVSALHHGRLQQWHSKVFPSSINEVAKSFANIFLEQEALSHPQPQAPFPSPLSQVLTELPSFCHIAGP